MSEGTSVNQLEDVLDNYTVNRLSFDKLHQHAQYIINNLTLFNNSVIVKQKYKYIPYNDFHTGYNNLHFYKNKQAIGIGKRQIKNLIFIKYILNIKVIQND